MMMRWRFFIVGAMSALAFGLTIPAVNAGCTGSSAVTHRNPDTGGFVIEELAGRGVGPPIRFWAYGYYSQANSGTQGQFIPGNEWLVQELNNHPNDEFYLYQANWFGRGIVGCYLGLTERIVVEMSYFLHSEGRPDHYTIYLIASVERKQSIIDFCAVTNGNGRGPGFVKAIPIPIPQVTGPAAESQYPGFMNVTLNLPEAPYFGDAGVPKLIKGYRVLYHNDSVPTTSYPSFYAPVRDPNAPSSALGVIPTGSTVQVAVPTPRKETYFVSLLVYEDPVAEITSSGTSGNSSPVTPPSAEEKTDQGETEATEGQTPEEDTAGTDASEQAGDSGEGQAPSGTEDSGVTASESEAQPDAGPDRAGSPADSPSGSDGSAEAPRSSSPAGATEGAPASSSPNGASTGSAPGGPVYAEPASTGGVTTFSGGESSSRASGSRTPATAYRESFRNERERRTDAARPDGTPGPAGETSRPQASRTAPDEGGPAARPAEVPAATGSQATTRAGIPEGEAGRPGPEDVSLPAERAGGEGRGEPTTPPASGAGESVGEVSRFEGPAGAAPVPESQRPAPPVPDAGVQGPSPAPPRARAGRSPYWYLGDAFMVLLVLTLGYAAYSGRKWT